MGYKYFAFAGTSQLFDEDARPATVDSTLLQNVIRDRGSAADAVVLGIQTNYFARTKRMHSYAERKYIRGLPTADYSTITVLDSDIRAAIERATGDIPGTFRSSYTGPIDEIFLARWWLKNNYLNEDFFPWSSIHGLPIGGIWDEILEYIQIPVANLDEPGFYYQAVNEMDIVRIPGPLPDTWLTQLRFHYIDSEGAPQTWSTPDIDFSAYDIGNWIQVAYAITNSPSETSNYNFELGDSGWENVIAHIYPAVKFSIVQEHAQEGTWAGKVRIPAKQSAQIAATNKAPVTPGEVTSAECWVLHQGAAAVSDTFIKYYDSNDVLITTFGGGHWDAAKNPEILNQWMRSEMRGIAPEGVAYARIGFHGYNPKANPPATMYFDHLSWDLEQPSEPEDTAETEYFLYQVGSGVDPILEDAIVASSGEAQYLPIAILMHDKVWFDDPPDTELHKTTKKLLKYLAVRGDDIKEDYLEQQAEDIASGDDERDGAEEWDFFIHFACSIHSKIRGSMEYMFHWLRELEQIQTTTFETYNQYLLSNPLRGSQPQSRINITEGDIDGFNADYAWSYVQSNTYEGTFVDEDGEELITNRMHSALYERGIEASFPLGPNDAEYKVGIEEMHGVGTPIAAVYDWDHTLFDPESEGQYQPDYVIFTKQLADINGNPYYIRVICMGLSQRYVINTLNVDPLTQESNYNFRYAVQYMFGNTENVSVDLRILLKMDTLKEVMTMQREDCVSDSLVATVFLVKIVHVKWYQTGFFKWLIVIIAIVLIVLSFYYGGASAMAEALGTALGLSGTLLVMFTWAMVFAIGFIISFAGALIGGTAGRVFQIIGMLSMAGGNPFKNIKSAWSKMRDDFGWATAQAFLATINPFMDITMILYTDYETRKLEQEQRDWLKTAEERWDELEEAWADLGQLTWIDPLDVVRAMNERVDESPNDFYARTLNPNPGLLVYDMINEFSEVSLTLPQSINDTNVLETMFESMRFQRGGI